MAQELKQNVDAKKSGEAKPVAAEKKPEAKAIAAEKKTGVQAEKKTEVSAEKKVEAGSGKKAEGKKVEKKQDKKEEAKKAEIVKKKFIQYVKKENKAKSKEAREAQKKIASKRNIPTFRGRFGKKNIRRKSIAKWDKWRKPHGIDLDKGLQHGFRPKIGYGSSAETKYVHPSGYMEAMVCNLNDLEKINPKTHAARLSSVLGKRKRNMIVKKANEKGIWVLN